jgi:hypothetical protein
MSFKRRIEWRKLLTVAGWIGLGYFIGRPDQLERLARNLNNNPGATRTVYLKPTVNGTAPNVAYSDRNAGQPEVVNTTPGKYGWNDFYHQEGRFSIVVPPLPVKQVTNPDGGTTFSIETENEFYSFGYQDTEANLIDNNQKQASLAETGRTATKSFGSGFGPIAQRSFALNGNPGIETHYRHKTKPIKMIVRQMFVGDRLYSMAVGSPHHQYTQVFMNSFRVY